MQHFAACSMPCRRRPCHSARQMCGGASAVAGPLVQFCRPADQGACRFSSVLAPGRRAVQSKRPSCCAGLTQPTRQGGEVAAVLRDDVSGLAAGCGRQADAVRPACGDAPPRCISIHASVCATGTHLPACELHSGASMLCPAPARHTCSCPHTHVCPPSPQGWMA